MKLELASLIISIVSLGIGIPGFIITIITWRNTKNIAKGIAAEKIKKIYPQKHRQFVVSFYTAQVSLKEGSKKYFIVFDLLKTCSRIQKYYDNWDIQDKRVIDKFTKNLNRIPMNKDFKEKTGSYLIKEILVIMSLLERIGDLNGIREIRGISEQTVKKDGGAENKMAPDT